VRQAHILNEVRLWLSLIAYNLGNLWRRLVKPKKIELRYRRGKSWRLAGTRYWHFSGDSL
jgi:hypothetical protein